MTETSDALRALTHRSSKIRSRLQTLYQTSFEIYQTSYDDSSHIRTEIERLSTKLAEVHVTDDSSTEQDISAVDTATLSLVVYRDLVEMHDVLIQFDDLVEQGNFVRASASVSEMARLLVRITAGARGIAAVETVKLQVSKKRARLNSRLSQLFAESFLVSAEEASVTIKRRHNGVHGHAHYDTPVKISTLLQSMWHVDQQTRNNNSSNGNDMNMNMNNINIPVGSFLHTQLIDLASTLSTSVLKVATSDGNVRPESSTGTHWSKIQFVSIADGSTSSSSNKNNTMNVDQILDRILIVLDLFEVELCSEEMDAGENDDDDDDDDDEEVSTNSMNGNSSPAKELRRLLGRNALNVIGEVLWSPNGVLTKIVLEVLRNALPMDEKEMSTFDRVVEAARRFEIRLSESGWLSSGSEHHFAAFVNDADRQFIQKRRTAILVSTRDMLLQDYHNSVMIEAEGIDGNNGTDKETDVLVASENNGGGGIGGGGSGGSRGSGSSRVVGDGLLSIPKMSVTRCAYRVVETLHSILRQATSGVGDEHAMMLWQTARDVVEMFRIVVPTAHRDHIATMPRIAMLFYCDCRYIAHHTMVIAHIYRSKLPNPLNRSASMIDLAPPLRSDGAHAFVDQIKTQRQELVRMMVRVGDLSCLTDDAIGENAENAVSGILYHLNKLCKLWSDVLPNTNTNGSLHSSIFNGSGSGNNNNTTTNNGGVSGDGGGGSNGSNSEKQPAVFHRAMGALLGVVATELVKRVDALGMTSGKDNTHEMQHLLRILIDGALGIFGEGASVPPLEHFVPSWSNLMVKGGI